MPASVAGLSTTSSAAAAVELSNGDMLMNMRSLHGRNRRAMAHRRETAATWTEVRLQEELIEPGCQASLIRCGSGCDNDLLFASPAATKRGQPHGAVEPRRGE